MSEPSDAPTRLVRLLALLAYLANAGEASLSELATRFSMSEPEVVADLELAACCGLPPYTPDQLLELVIDDGKVSAFGLDALRRPPKLTPDEGFALAASAHALLEVGADEGGALRGALTKLEAALGASEVHVELEVPPALAALRSAAASHTVVEIDYLGAARGERTTRVVEPVRVVLREGRFYLDAYCRLAGDWRRFGVARVEAVRPMDEGAPARTPPAELAGPRAFAGGRNTLLGTVEVPERLAPGLERFAAGPGTTGPDGRVTFEIEVADRAWFGRLLLRLGPEATVVSPPELAGAGADIARKALEHYR